MAKTMAPAWRRLLIYLAMIVGAVLAAVIVVRIYNQSRLPRSAPERIQQQGLARVNQILRFVEQSPFGQSRRGQLLCDQLHRLIEQDQVLFVTGLGVVGMYMEIPLGEDKLLVDVIEFGPGAPEDQRFCLPDDAQIARAIFHEAVHSLRTEIDCADEECDGMAAAFQAEAALAGKSLPAPIPVDGATIAEHVRARYKDLEPDQEYKPVGMSRAELESLAGRL